jgi:hypothetical protein
MPEIDSRIHIIEGGYSKLHDLVEAEGVDLVLLEPVCKIRKEEYRSKSDHSREIGGAFLITSSNATELL